MITRLLDDRCDPVVVCSWAVFVSRRRYCWNWRLVLLLENVHWPTLALIRPQTLLLLLLLLLLQ